MSSRRFFLTTISRPVNHHGDNRNAHDIESDLKRKLHPHAAKRWNLLPRPVQNAVLANIADGLVTPLLIARQLNDPESTFDDLSW